MLGSYDAIADLHAERRTFFARTGIGLLICIAVLGVLLVRMSDLQIEQHDYFSTRSNENRMRVVVVPPVRGLIFDREGRVLAENTPSYVLQVVPEQVDDIEATLERLARIIALTPGDRAQFHRQLQQTPAFRGVVLRSQLSMAEVAAYEVNRHRFPGVSVKAVLSRSYPAGASAAHVVGYVGGITSAELATLDESAYRGTYQIGKTGIEKVHEGLLHGSVGAKIVEANASGRPLRELDYQPGSPGQNLYLSLDLRLQRAAEAALAGREGAIVAIDPGNGEVLALVSRPTYDPQLFVDGIGHDEFRALNSDATRPLFNRATQGQYPPGSTIKPLVGLAALEYHAVTPSTTTDCEGHFTLPNVERLYRDWKRRGHGVVDLNAAIAESCDVYFYQTALELGIDRIHDMLAQFSLGAKTGIDLPGEASGILPSRDWKRRVRGAAWFPGETLIAGIGQGYMTATPLQLAQATARLATRGAGFTPRLLRALEDPGTSEPIKLPAAPLPAVAVENRENWSEIIRAMTDVTTSIHGTAYRHMHDAPITVAGKTGTAQVAGLSQEDEDAPDIEDVPKRLRDHALFVAFAPVEAPEIALSVVVEHGGSGGGVAAPIARQVINAFAEIRNEGVRR